MATPNPAVSSRGAKNQVRIRGPKPTVSLQCDSLQDMGQALDDLVKKELRKPVADFIYCQFILDADVPLVVEELPSEWKDVLSVPHDERWDQPVQMTVLQAVTSNPDSRQKMKRQRAITRQILKEISAVDGSKYFEKEAWDTKHTDGFRFKFTCRESSALKDKEKAQIKRQESGGTPNGLAQANGEDADATAHDCKGHIFIKFSSSVQIIDIVYQHIPGHQTQPSRKRSRDANDDGHSEVQATPTAMVKSQPNSHAATPVTNSSKPPPIMSTTEVIEDSAPRAKRRKRTSKVPELEDIVVDATTVPKRKVPTILDDPPTEDVGHFRRDYSLSPTREAEMEHYPDDKEFLRPSIVTCVPSLSTKVRSSLKSGARNSSDDTGLDGKGKKKSRSKAVRKDVANSKDKDAGIKAAKAAPPTSAPKSKGQKNSTNASSTVASAQASAAATPTNGSKKSSVLTDVIMDDDSAVSASDRPQRRRAKTGCWTCRTRKLKCDEQRPRCTQCARSKPPRTCAYPGEGEDEEDDEMDIDSVPASPSLPPAPDGEDTGSDVSEYDEGVKAKDQPDPKKSDPVYLYSVPRSGLDWLIEEAESSKN